MEEGPEPQEWVERSVEHHHHEEHGAGGGGNRSTVMSAITAAILAVCAALGSLLSGHYANEGIRSQVESSDQWSFFQAKSTKGHIYQVGAEVIRTLASEQNANPATLKSLADMEKKTKRYDSEKQEIEDKARELGSEGEHYFEKHHKFAIAVATFQIGIVLASISIMVKYRALWFGSLAAGIIGIAFLLTGFII